MVKWYNYYPVALDLAGCCIDWRDDQMAMDLSFLVIDSVHTVSNLVASWTLLQYVRYNENIGTCVESGPTQFSYFRNSKNITSINYLTNISKLCMTRGGGGRR